MIGGFDNLLYRKTDAFIMKDVGIKPDEIGGYKEIPCYSGLRNIISRFASTVINVDVVSLSLARKPLP